MRVGSAYSGEFKVKVGVYQGSVRPPLLFAIVVDVITKNGRRGVVNELLYVDDLVLMKETMEDLKERFWSWKDALESEGLKLNTTQIKVMVSGWEGKLLKSKIDSCGVWVHERCAKIKRVTTRLAMHFACLKCKRIMEEMVDSIEKSSNEVETVNRFCYLGERLNASGGCEAAVIARLRIDWVIKFKECGKLLFGNRFPLKMKGTVLKRGDVIL